VNTAAAEGRSRPSRGWTIGALVIWAVVVSVARWWGERLNAELGPEALRLGAPPLVGRDDPQVTAGLLVPVAVGAILVWFLPILTRRLAWRRVLVLIALVGVAWPVAVNVSRGLDGLTDPVSRTDEYLVDVPLIGSPRVFLDQYVERIDDYSPHVRSHPPGFVLLLWGMDQLGLSGPGWVAALCIAGGAGAAAVVLWIVRRFVDEPTARAAAPFLVLAPSALWVASTADAWFALLGAGSMALVICAAHNDGRRRIALAVAGGIVFSVAAMSSYGLWLIWLIAAPTLLKRRAIDVGAIAGIVTVAILASLTGFGFNYLHAFRATQIEVAESVQSTRPTAFALFSNLAAFGLACGPAAAVALARLRDRRLWLLVSGAVGAVVVANLSLLSKGEVERIWFPFGIWILAAGACLGFAAASAAGAGTDPVRTGVSLTEARLWLGLQVATAIVIQTLVRTGW